MLLLLGLDELLLDLEELLELGVVTELGSAGPGPHGVAGLGAHGRQHGHAGYGG